MCDTKLHHIIVCDNIILNPNSKLKIKKTKRKQENKIKSTVHNSDTRLLVCATLNLAYSKKYVYYMPLIYSIILFFRIFYILLCVI